MITILAVGKKHEAWISDGLERYQKRLRQPFGIKWELIAHSSLEGGSAREEESQRLLGRLNANDFVVLLDEVGKNFNNNELTSLLQDAFINGKSVIFVIGGAYGVNQSMQQRADIVWSLSRLVFPHQLVRLIVTEQIYRSQSLANGSHYHHS